MTCPVSLTLTSRDKLNGQRVMYWIRRSMPAASAGTPTGRHRRAAMEGSQFKPRPVRRRIEKERESADSAYIADTANLDDGPAIPRGE